MPTARPCVLTGRMASACSCAPGARRKPWAIQSMMIPVTAARRAREEASDGIETSHSTAPCEGKVGYESERAAIWNAARLRRENGGGRGNRIVANGAASGTWAAVDSSMSEARMTIWLALGLGLGLFVSLDLTWRHA